MATKAGEGGGKEPARFRFRKGDVIDVAGVPVKMTTHNGRRVVELPKSAGAKVRKVQK